MGKNEKLEWQNGSKKSEKESWPQATVSRGKRG
jgi:hypothetical protein